jgi:hypothetical protein
LSNRTKRILFVPAMVMRAQVLKYFLIRCKSTEHYELDLEEVYELNAADRSLVKNEVAKLEDADDPHELMLRIRCRAGRQGGRQTDRQKDRWMNRRTDGQMGGRTDRWTDRQTLGFERQTDRQAGGHRRLVITC